MAWQPDVIHPGVKWWQPHVNGGVAGWKAFGSWVESAGSHTPCIMDLLKDSKKLSSFLDCFGDQKAIKTPKLNTI